MESIKLISQIDTYRVVLHGPEGRDHFNEYLRMSATLWYQVMGTALEMVGSPELEELEAAFQKTINQGE